MLEVCPKEVDGAPNVFPPDPNEVEAGVDEEPNPPNVDVAGLGADEPNPKEPVCVCCAGCDGCVEPKPPNPVDCDALPNPDAEGCWNDVEVCPKPDAGTAPDPGTAGR